MLSGSAKTRRNRIVADDVGTGHSSLAICTLTSTPSKSISTLSATTSRGHRPVGDPESIIRAGRHDSAWTWSPEGAETDSDAVELYHWACRPANTRKACVRQPHGCRRRQSCDLLTERAAGSGELKYRCHAPGRDPGIHPFEKLFFRRLMDTRVKTAI